MTLFAEVGNAIKYAAIYQTGGVIRAKRAKFLTIPTRHNQTRSGVTRVGARLLFARGNAFVSKGVIFENRGKKRKPVPMFVLKKQVRVKKSLTFFESASSLTRIVVNRLTALLGGR